MKNERQFIKYYGIEAAKEVVEKDGNCHYLVLNCASGDYGFWMKDLINAIDVMEKQND